MSYKFAENNYTPYEQKIYEIVSSKSKISDFLRKQEINDMFGVSVDFGKKYCLQLSLEFPEFVKLCKMGHFKNELNELIKIGYGEVFFSPELERFVTGNVSRYIYHALVIIKYIQSKFPDRNVDIVEIGGGYGGLCYCIKSLYKNIGEYNIVDLNLALELQKKCLTTLNTEFTPISVTSGIVKKENPLFCISNYGYSAFSQKYQEFYKESVISECDAGFMVWNNWSGIYNFTNLPMNVEPERPCFCPNKFIYF
jgi:hypothetical protein